MRANYTLEAAGDLTYRSLEDAFQVSSVSMVSDSLLPAILSSVSRFPLPMGSVFFYLVF